MRGVALLSELRDRGLSVTAREGRIEIIPVHRVSPYLSARIARQRKGLLEALEREAGSKSWSRSCVEGERRFGQPHARLFPLLGTTVQTPMGPGVLVQVHAGRCAVYIPRFTRRLIFFEPDALRPVPGG